MDGNATVVLLKQIIDLLRQNSGHAFNISKDEVLTLKELSQRLKISTSAIEQRVKSGKFPSPAYIGGKRMWTTSMINMHVYEENPHLRERDHLLAEARRITGDAS